MNLFLRTLAVLFILQSSAWAQIITDVRGAIARNDFKSAAGILSTYRAQHGIDPEYLEALSWMGRGELAAGDFKQAYSFAEETEKLTAQVARDNVDQNPHLATA